MNHLYLSLSYINNLSKVTGLYLYTSWMYASFTCLYKIIDSLGKRRPDGRVRLEVTKIHYIGNKSQMNEKIKYLCRYIQLGTANRN